MYESPINLKIEEFVDNVQRATQNQILYKVREIVDVDRDELIRALKYDRDQYYKGFKDGKRAGWISVKERLPEEHGEYLVCFRYDVPDFDSKPHFDVLDFNEKGKFFEISGSGWFQSYGIYGIITHWKPIEPPEVEE